MRITDILALVLVAVTFIAVSGGVLAIQSTWEDSNNLLAQTITVQEEIISTQQRTIDYQKASISLLKKEGHCI